MFAKLNTDLLDWEVSGNYLEACFWIAIGITFFVTRKRANPLLGRMPLLVGCLFVIFGCSDVVEAQTGAWWRPLWLLAWKALCILALTCCYWRYLRMKNVRVPSWLGVPVGPAAGAAIGAVIGNQDIQWSYVAAGAGIGLFAGVGLWLLDLATRRIAEPVPSDKHRDAPRETKAGA